LAIVALIFAFTVPVGLTLMNRNDLEVAANTVTQDYRRAQLHSQAVDGDMTWGVNVQIGLITIFKGNDYAGRDQNFDENFDMSTSITVSGSSETIFEKFTGYPRVAGTLTLTSPNNETRNITINEKGIVNY
jgi:Tfp pilus assembly protein FimT